MIRVWFQQAEALSQAGQHGIAAQRYRVAASSFATPGEEPELRAWCCYRAAVALSELERWDEAVESCCAGMAAYPSMPELPWYAAYCASRAGDYAKAVYFAHIAIALVDKFLQGPPQDLMKHEFKHAPAWHEGPYDVLRFAYRALGEGYEAKAKWAEDNYQQLQLNHRQTSVDPWASWHPEIEGWSSDILPFYDRLAKQATESDDDFSLIEIGVWHGRSILFLAERLSYYDDEPDIGALDEGRASVYLAAVDIDLHEFYKNAGRLADRHCIEAYQLDLVTAAEVIDHEFDVVFIDAMHDYESVKRDIYAWCGKVKLGGLLCGHDYMHAGEHAGVGRAVDEIFGAENVLVEGSVWQVRKRASDGDGTCIWVKPEAVKP